jgi:hypothetical protein
MIKTCTHTYDSGRACLSAAAKDRDFCVYHLRYRARRLRMARARAHNLRLHFELPPLEDMHAVQSALTQLAEALAAGIVDPKQAQAFVSILRLASSNLLSAAQWPANVYHSDDAPAVDVAAEFGLPSGLDLATPPEVAFPPPATEKSPAGCPAVPAGFAGAGGWAHAAPAAAVRQPAPSLPREPGFVPAALRTSEDGDFEVRPDFPISPETVEVCTIYETQGPDAAQVRCEQLERNRARRELRLDRKRYAEVALQCNLQAAAKKLAGQKLAAQASNPESPAVKKAVSSADWDGLVGTPETKSTA